MEKRIKFTLVFNLIAVALLSSCSNTPMRDMPKEQAPLNWQNSHAAITAKAMTGTQNPWWFQLKDTTLNNLIAEAIKSNPDLLSAQSVIRAARAYRKQVQGSLLPVLSANLGSGVSQSFNPSDSSQSYSAVLDASWEPDLFGTGQSTLAAADAEGKAAYADYADALITLSAEVTSNYIALRNSQKQLHLTQDSLQSWQETLQLVEWQQQAGIVSQLDLEQAKRSYQQTVASIPSIQQTIIESQYQLAVLLGRQPEQLPEYLTEPGDIPQIPSSVFMPLPAEVLRQRPDIRAAEQRVMAAIAQTELADRNRLPNFTLGGKIGWSATSISDLFNINALATSLSASLLQTIFDGGQLDAKLERQQEIELQTILSYRKTVLEALRETENALANLDNTRQSYLALQQALLASEQEEKLALIQYQAGAISFSDVLTAQRTRLTLRKQIIETQVAELAQIITLSKAIAGDWAMQQAVQSVGEQ
ncbi:RND transporter [uncultured Thiomicrorhabdus sp.]